MAWADVSPKIKFIFKKISTFVNQTSGKKELQNVSKYVKNSYKGEFNLIITPISCKIVIFIVDRMRLNAHLLAVKMDQS